MAAASATEAICEAVTNPNMQFGLAKTVEQQSGLTRATGESGRQRGLMMLASEHGDTATMTAS